MALKNGLSLLNSPQYGGLSPIGEMKGLPDFLGQKMAWLDINLRGAGQVVFMNNPMTGLLIIVGLATFNWKTALYGVLSLFAGTTTAMTLHSQGYAGFGSHTDGLYGFNAILVGLAIGTFSKDAQSDDFFLNTQTAALCIFFGVLSSVIMNSLSKWMPTPAFTLPFNMSIMWFFAGTLSYSHMTTNMTPHLPVAPETIRTCLRSSAQGDCDMENVFGFLVASLHGVCEIFLAGSPISAVWILTGMALCSPLAAFCGLAGSIVGLAMGILLGVDGNTLYLGLYGFNPALTTMAIGGGIFAKPSPRAFVWAIFGAVASVFMNGTLSAVLAPCGLPSFTLAFCLVAVLLVGAGFHNMVAEDDDEEEEQDEAERPLCCHSKAVSEGHEEVWTCEDVWTC